MRRGWLPAALLAVPAHAFAPALPGAEEVLRAVEPVATHRVALAAFRPDPVVRTVEGALARTVWTVPGDAASAALMRLIRDQAEAAGYETVFACETRGCGGFDFRFGIDVAAPPAMFVDLADFRYLAARRGDDWVTALVSRTGAAGQVQVTTVTTGVAGGEAPAATLSTRAAPVGPVAEALAAEGRAVLADVTFASGSAVLEGGGGSLPTLAAWLAARPGATLALVGHTDAVGGAEGNIAISRRRAEAVRAALIDLGADPARLEARGVGYFAPLAANDTSEGRARNRRVEAVVTSVE